MYIKTGSHLSHAGLKPTAYRRKDDLEPWILLSLLLKC